MTSETLLASLHLSIPELILAIGSLVLLMIGVFSGERSGRMVSVLAIILLAVAALWLVFVPSEGLAYGGVFLSDGFGRFMKVTALVGSIVALFMSLGLAKENQLDKFEFPVLLVLCTLGILLMISANNLISLYLGLELQSLAIYVVAAINRDSVKSTEAGLKYFVLGALSSGMLLYGMSLVYGFTGTVSFAGIAKAASAGASGAANLGLVFGLVFLFAGFCFKV